MQTKKFFSVQILFLHTHILRTHSPLQAVYLVKIGIGDLAPKLAWLAQPDAVQRREVVAPCHDAHVTELFKGEVVGPLAKAGRQFGLLVKDAVATGVQLEDDFVASEQGQIGVLGDHKVGNACQCKDGDSIFKKMRNKTPAKIICLTVQQTVQALPSRTEPIFLLRPIVYVDKK